VIVEAEVPDPVSHQGKTAKHVHVGFCGSLGDQRTMRSVPAIFADPVMACAYCRSIAPHPSAVRLTVSGGIDRRRHIGTMYLSS